MREYEFYYTQDGSIGLYSYSDNDVYHSKFGAVTEAWDKFIISSNISKIINTSDNINVLDICYGIGYNTKALMSFVINHNEKFLTKENFFKKIFKKFFQKKYNSHDNNVSIDANKPRLKKEILSEPIETNNEEIISTFNIDCLDINEELIKISPLLKTVITPQEIFTRICPRIFDCFDTYWKIKKLLSKLTFIFAPKNKKEIEEILNLKFENNYNELIKDYRIHDFVNYILINNLVEKYESNYLDTPLKNIIKEKRIRPFIDNTMYNYALFKQDFIYKLIGWFDLQGFLHNIYYDHLSKRYKKAKFKSAEKLFKLNFYPNDARKTIFSLNKKYDLIFLDAFTYSKAPELWSVEFIAELYKRMSARGILMTYSNSALVRKTFLDNNFYVGKILDSNTGKFIGTIATKDKTLIEHPLSNYEIGLCNTRAGIPYHDQTLNLPKEVILKNRELEFKNSNLPTSSQYARLRKNNGDLNNE